jgi:hypothetical protein
MTLHYLVNNRSLLEPDESHPAPFRSILCCTPIYALTSQEVTSFQLQYRLIYTRLRVDAFLDPESTWITSNEVRILWRIDPFLGNARNTHAPNNRGAVFSMVRARTVAMQRTLNTFFLTRWRHRTIERLCFLLWSVPSVYKGQQKGCFLRGPHHAQCW